jgi:hypothetical protein
MPRGNASRKQNLMWQATRPHLALKIAYGGADIGGSEKNETGLGRDEFLCLAAFLFLLVPCGTGLPA